MLWRPDLIAGALLAAGSLIAGGALLWRSWRGGRRRWHRTPSLLATGWVCLTTHSGRRYELPGWMHLQVRGQFVRADEVRPGDEIALVRGDGAADRGVVREVVALKGRTRPQEVLP